MFQIEVFLSGAPSEGALHIFHKQRAALVFFESFPCSPPICKHFFFMARKLQKKENDKKSLKQAP